MAEAGELIMAKVNESQLIELGELQPYFTSSSSSSSSSEELSIRDGNVIFKCVGMGIMDLAIARTLLDMAHEQGYGTVVDGFGET